MPGLREQVATLGLWYVDLTHVSVGGRRLDGAWPACSFHPLLRQGLTPLHQHRVLRQLPLCQVLWARIPFAYLLLNLGKLGPGGSWEALPLGPLRQ